MKYVHTMKPKNTCELTFRELMNEDIFKPHRKEFLHEFKNMMYHSHIENLFQERHVNGAKQVKLVYSKIRNPLTEVEHNERGLKTIYHPYLSAVAIPLMGSVFQVQATGILKATLYVGVSTCQGLVAEVHVERSCGTLIHRVRPHRLRSVLSCCLG